MADIRGVNKDFIEEFIYLYRSLPCLWKRRSAEYSNSALKNAAYGKLIEKLREVVPDASKITVVKKIDSLRASFRKEFKKVQDSKKLKAETNKIYKPRLWYYEKLLFLKEQVPPRINKRSSRRVCNFRIKDPLSDELSNFSDILSEHDQSRMLTPQGDETRTSTSSSKESCKASFTHSRKHKQLDLCDKDLTNVYDQLQMKEDEFDIIGKNLAIKLRRFPHEVKTVTEKIISDILYQADIGAINLCTTIAIHNPTSTTNMTYNSQLIQQQNCLCSPSSKLHC